MTQDTERSRVPAIPTELHDPDGGIMALRIDGPADTRGKARAFFAHEWDIDFTAVRLRRTAYREWREHIAEMEADGIPEPYDGWPLIECGPGEEGHPYWALDEVHRG
jgi:hypothetical protein